MSKNNDTDKDKDTEETLSLTRRRFLQATGAAGAMYWLGPTLMIGGEAYAAIPGGDLDLTKVPRFVMPLLIPPVMPKSPNGQGKVAPGIDYYEIAVTQFPQQILPLADTDGNPLNPTMVWGYGPAHAKGRRQNRISNAPSLTIEATANVPVRVKWINGLVDANGNYLPHLLPVDPTLHWANPPQGSDINRNYGAGTIDSRPGFNVSDGAPDPYIGPVPLVTHLHGAVGVGQESDGYTEAWFLPAAADIPAGYATEGTYYTIFKPEAQNSFGAEWGPGYAVFQYPNENRACTLWYHDHALGITRLNVYAGPAGFYLVRGGPDGDSAVLDGNGLPAVLPGPAPQENDQFPSNKRYYEIPIVIQDRSFNADGSLFYPDSRVFFGDDFPVVPASDFIPNGDLSPIWNPEFFGNTLMVNGNTWPFLEVEQRRYRLRFLNGCQSRFLILDFSQIQGVEVWQIGNDGGFLPVPVNLTSASSNQLLMALAERADLIVDFTNVPTGNYVLGNVGPDEPFNGGPFDAADADSTGQVMEFRVVPAVDFDNSTPPAELDLSPANNLSLPATVDNTRRVALLEVVTGDDQPIEALLGTVDGDPFTGTGVWTEKLWSSPVTELPAVGDTEIWEIYNTTGDAHPIHVHEVVFEVLDRTDILIDEGTQSLQVDGASSGPEPWETGFKDTVIAYPEQVTRIKAQFNRPGRFVWHCHIIEHEDNEMMRPFEIREIPPV